MLTHNGNLIPLNHAFYIVIYILGYICNLFPSSSFVKMAETTLTLLFQVAKLEIHSSVLFSLNRNNL